MNIGIYGGKGYLGNLIASMLAESNDVNLLERDAMDLDKLELVIDCSIPRDLHKKRIRNDYFQLMSDRLDIVEKSAIKYIYLGSFSSSNSSKSHYGRAKFKCENEVLIRGGSILRIPLVIDRKAPGSRAQELDKIVGRLPIVFLPHETMFNLKVIDPETFLHTLNELVSQVESRQPREIFVECETVSLKYLILNLPSFENKTSVNLSRPQSIMLELILRILPLGRFNNIRSLIGVRNVS
jgi:hypothetical protein